MFNKFCPKKLTFVPNPDILYVEVGIMKKKNIINLIKYHSEHNEVGFKEESYEIAKYFNDIGDYQIAEYIMALTSDANSFVPQLDEDYSSYFTKLDVSVERLPMPDVIRKDILGIVNAIGHNVSINKFLFQGPPGTGKTESAKNIARILKRDLYMIQFETMIDSKLGHTVKNIAKLFDEIKSIENPEKVIILFDEIDSIAIDRINSNDLREMGRATSAVLKGFDSISDNIVLIATTNLYKSFDKALIRRFDYVVNFDRYTKDDLIDIAEIILNDLLMKFKHAGRNMKLLKKILKSADTIPYPGELKNLLKACVAFSSDEYEYFSRLYKEIKKQVNAPSLKQLKEEGFTLREIEILTGISKSQVAREVNA